MEIWLVWLRDGEQGDTVLNGPAHRTREGARAWCNENRKLEHGDPIEWKVSGGADPVEYGESRNVVLDLGRTRERITRYYSLQVTEVKS
jgi:hypothetical protein